MNRFNTPVSNKKMRREKTTLSNSSDSDQDKEPVHVYCRLRPLRDDNEQAKNIKIVSASTLSVNTIDSRSVKREIHYKFDHIFTAFSTQKEVFRHVAYPLLEDLLHGKNGLLFTYGVTGSGKTFTLTGDQNNPGVMPNCINAIFNTIGDCQIAKCIIKSDKMNGFEIQTEDDAIQDRLQAVRSYTQTPKRQRKLNPETVTYANNDIQIANINKNNLYAVFVSYIEVYNNNVFDLLDESSGKTLQNKILREDCNKNVYVNGVIELEVKSAQEAFEVFQTGQNRKKMAATCLNAISSRSHSIFNVRVVQLEQNADHQLTVPSDNVIKVGQLSFVDLAGSERTNRTNNTGVRLKEASSINNSLMTLRTCLEILRENQLNKTNRLVPYRDSRLTFFFKRFFEGDGTVKMIVCINPSLEDLEENLHVLKFAEMTQDVKVTKPEIKYTPVTKVIARSKPKKTPSRIKEAMLSAMLPEIPIFNLDHGNINQCRSSLDKVISILKLRMSKQEELDREIEEKQDEFRRRLVEINDQSVLNAAEIRSLKAVIKKERAKEQNLQVKIGNLEVVNQELQSKNEALEDNVRSLRNVVDEKDLKINQQILEKQKAKQKLALASEKMTQELDVKLRRQRDHLNAAMKAKDEKLRMVKGILDSEVPPIELNHHLNLEPEPESTPKSFASHTPIKSTSNLHKKNGTVSAPRNRRSRSTGDMWLEHNVIKPCPLGTVMQPSMRKRKSVSKLDKASDITNPKQSKYCLVAQEADAEGEMETKLYKADIVPTISGGAQVVFNDVERLTQESPTKDA